MQFNSIMKMKRLIAILFLLLMSLGAIAQLEVKPGSFKEAPGFVNINPDPNYQYDDNNLPFAVIKVRTENITDKQRRDLRFESNLATAILLEYKTGEVWVYVTAKYANYLKISHPDFSSIEFTIPFDLEQKKGYEMTLVNKAYSPQSLSINSNWVVVKVTPKDAIINIDGNYYQNGKAMLSVDEPHELNITHPLYHPYRQEIYSDANEKKTYEIKLNPAYGWLEIDSKPESGATVLINGVKKGVTPFYSDTLVSGYYEVTVLKDMYKNASKKLIVSDNNVTKENIIMTPNFAEVTLKTDRNADIFIDDIKVGTGEWVGRIAEGEHIVEAKKESHRKAAISVNVTSGKNESFIIPDPIPIYGALNINSEPDEAIVYLDGMKIGETPFVKNNVLIGEHTLVFTKEKHETLTKTVNIEEGKIININETLTKQVSSVTLNATSQSNIMFHQQNDDDPSGEGMWLPMFVERLNYVDMQKMGLQLTPEELYNINNSSLKDAIVGLSNGAKPRGFFCTGEIVSKNSLLFTNHHCGYSSIAALSTVEHDWLNDGFWAKSFDEELPAEGVSASFLVRMEDVTAEILSVVTVDMDWWTRNNAINVKIKELEEAASESGKLNPVIKGFFEGNEYYMFVYKTYTDVRLVGTPPQSIGKFGGDTDNWMWPRHTGDISVFRVYADENGEPAEYSENNKPLTPKRNLEISLDGVQPDDFTMIWGFPGSTERYMSSYGINYNVDVFYPIVCELFKAETDVMDEYMKVDKAVNIAYADNKAGLANTWKNFEGQITMLRKNKVAERKAALEADFTEWVNANEDRKAEYGDVLGTLETNYAQMGEAAALLFYPNFLSQLNPLAVAPEFAAYYETMTSKEVSKEDKKAATEELKAMDVDAMFKDLDTRVEKDMFIAVMNIYGSKFSKEDLPVEVQKLLSKSKGDWTALANYIFDNSIFSSPETIKAFIEKPNAKKIAKDPAYIMYNALFEQIMSIVPVYRMTNVAIKAADHKFVKGLREFYAETQPDKVLYPDANSTMRLTYGPVKSYVSQEGKAYNYYTTSDDFLKKYIPGDYEFDAPIDFVNLLKNKDFGRYSNEANELPLCFLSKTDITGGNSGSPCINNKGELIGIAFDGNWEAMSGDVNFEPKLQRTINVDIRYILFIIDKYAGAQNIIDELDIKQ